MKRTINIAAIWLLALTAFMGGNNLFGQSNTVAADAILGKWANEDKTRIIEFVKAGNGYEAIVRDAPDKSLIGQKQITDLLYGNGAYKGKLYLPKKGKTLTCSARINTSGNLELTAKAGIMSKSQTWTKVN